MRYLLVLAIAIAALSIGTRARKPQNYPWCAHYDKGDGGMNCGFTSFQQCLEDVRGIGGFCEQNNTYRPPAAARPGNGRRSSTIPIPDRAGAACGVLNSHGGAQRYRFEPLETGNDDESISFRLGNCRCRGGARRRRRKRKIIRGVPNTAEARAGP